MYIIHISLRNQSKSSEINNKGFFWRAFQPFSDSIAKATWFFAIRIHVSDMTFWFFAVSLFFPVIAMFSLIRAVVNLWIRRRSFAIRRKRWSLIENNKTYYYNDRWQEKNIWNIDSKSKFLPDAWFSHFLFLDGHSL